MHRSSDRRSCCYSPGLGCFTSLRRRGRAPSDRRWPYRLRFVGVGAALRAPTVFSGSASLALPRTGLWVSSPRPDRRCRTW
jgi:hypothetical protein